MNRQLLEQPFNQNQIKQRQGAFGNTLDYIEAHAAIQRLNDSFDGNWSYDILSHEINAEADEVIVLGKLTAENVVKTQYFRFHALRHAGASIMDNNQVPIGAIQSILGHENRTTTEIYLHNLGSSEKDAMAVYERARNFSHTESHMKQKST